MKPHVGATLTREPARVSGCQNRDAPGRRPAQEVSVVQLHLFSTPGEPLLCDLVQACRAWLMDQEDPVVAYLPAAAVGDLWAAFTMEAFRDVAAVRLIDPDLMEGTDIDAALGQASLLYVPGGNTYRLRQRLEHQGLMGSLKRRVQAGLPLAAFSAGTVLCGQDILTTSDMNVCATTPCGGLAFTRFNFHVHYPAVEGPERQVRDGRLKEYHAIRPHSVLALEDGAYLRVMGEQLELMAGRCWRFDPGQAGLALDPGPIA